MQLVVITNELRKKLAADEIVLGAGVRQSRTVEIAMMMKTAGYDFLFVDLEHANLDFETVTQISVGALGTGITPLVRVPALEEHHISRTLDGGAQGIVAPHIDSVEEARELVALAKYPPSGKRSFGGYSAMVEFARTPAQDLMEILNRETIIVAMIETPRAAEAANEIAAVEGIDVLMIGANDITLELGVPGQYEHENVSHVFDLVTSACKKHGKTPGMGGVYEPGALKRRVREGIRFILCGHDMNFMIAGGTAQAEFVRGAVG